MGVRGIRLGRSASRLSAWALALGAVALLAGAGSVATGDLTDAPHAPLTRSTGLLVVDLAEGTDGHVTVMALHDGFSMARHGPMVAEMRPGLYNVTVQSGEESVWAEVELSGVVEIQAYHDGMYLHMQEMGGGHHMGMEGGMHHGGMGGGMMGGQGGMGDDA